FGEARGRRSVVGVAFRSVGFGPGDEGRDLLSGERRVVGEMTAARIGEPGWHDFGASPVRHLARLEARLLVGDERHGSDLAKAVAGLAVVLEDRENVAVEGGGSHDWLRACLLKAKGDPDQQSR